MKIEWTVDEWREWIMPLVASRYPDHCAILLAGSHTRGQATAQSDVDLIIFETSRRQAFRESFIYDGVRSKRSFIRLRQYSLFSRVTGNVVAHPCNE
ncbi:nucleotidyltransferase domain-containing protein [Exiguobacterium sp. SL14]|nr:nucleotidyltransferase domain-containing protein [Exiguobacterium sp. SL14]MCY1691065.1 nucleotidyltransferase domain-containing protein [Exiguobacterium sp. SL14]